MRSTTKQMEKRKGQQCYAGGNQAVWCDGQTDSARHREQQLARATGESKSSRRGGWGRVASDGAVDSGVVNSERRRMVPQAKPSGACLFVLEWGAEAGGSRPGRSHLHTLLGSLPWALSSHCQVGLDDLFSNTTRDQVDGCTVAAVGGVDEISTSQAVFSRPGPHAMSGAHTQVLESPW